MPHSLKNCSRRDIFLPIPTSELTTARHPLVEQLPFQPSTMIKWCCSRAVMISKYPNINGAEIALRPRSFTNHKLFQLHHSSITTSSSNTIHHFTGVDSLSSSYLYQFCSFDYLFTLPKLRFQKWRFVRPLSLRSNSSKMATLPIIPINYRRMSSHSIVPNHLHGY
jgi:hypothetical protein